MWRKNHHHAAVAGWQLAVVAGTALASGGL
jgi:hypothetical protein